MRARLSPPLHLFRPSRGGALAWTVAVLALLVLLLAAAIHAALHTEAGARTLWRAAVRFAPGQLSGEVAGGTVADGLRLRALRYQDETQLLSVDSIDGAWRLSLSPLSLTIESLRIGTVDVTRQPTPSEPATMPRSLRLPLALEVRDAVLRELVLHAEGGETRYRNLRLQAASDRVRHSLRLQQLDTPFGSLQGTLRLAGDAPFPLDGNIGLEGRYQDQAFRLDARLGGSLEALRVDADAGAGEFSGKAEIDAAPFSPLPLRRALIRVDDFDPRALNPDWPRAQLDLRASLVPEGPAADLSQLVVTGPVELDNARPGAIDKELLPLAAASATVRLDTRRQQLSDVVLRLAGNGSLTGGGEMRADGGGQFTLRASGLDLRALHGSLRPTRLAGPLSLQMEAGTQSVRLELADDVLAVGAEADMTADRIRVQSARLQAGNARLDLRGTLDRGASGAFAASGKLQDFNPARFAAQVQAPAGNKRGAQDRRRQGKSGAPDARINMDFEAEGALRPALRAELRFDIDDSSYAGLPMEGGGRLRLAGKRLLPSDADLQVAGNRILLKGSFGAPGDRVKFDVDAPALDRLGFGLAGRLQLSGEAAGTLERPQVNARYHGESLAFGAHTLAFLDGEASVQGVPDSSPDARLDLDLAARGVRSGEIAIATLNADIDGSYASHTIRVDAEGRLRGQPLALSAGARGRLRETPQGLVWDGSVTTLENRSEPRVALASPLPLAIGPGRIEAGSSRLSLARAEVELQGLLLDNGRVQSAGRFSALDTGHLLALLRQFTGIAPPASTSLVLDGSWDLALAESATGFLRIERRSGDVSIPGAAGETPLGIGTLSLRADGQGNGIAFTARAEAARIGKLDAEGRVQLKQVDGRVALGPESPLSARIRAGIPRLQTIASLAGPRIALDGTVNADVNVGGSIGDPRVTGTIDGDRLALTLFDQGVRLSDGVARIGVDNNVVELREVVFHGGDGTLRATGSIPVGGDGSGLNASIVADRLQLLASPTGRLTVSGQAGAATVDGQTLVSGKFTVDRALFSLPEKSAPKLGDDVVVIRSDRPPPEKQVPPGERRASPLSPRIDVAVDLGRNFRFEGSGAELRLAGTVNIRSAPGETPQAFGTVRVAEGTYEAFGTELAIERGVINFQGPLANPNLNILAMRREQEVDAGVQVTGTVQQPRVQLVSEPNVSDEEKLSWLIFGRGGGGTEQGQARAAAQGAALGLLNKFGGGRVAKGLGLDQLSIGASEFGLADSQVVNLGKEITDRLFIGYEQSLAGAESVLKLTYQLSRRWTVVVRGGAVTGMDLFYSRRFDRFGAPVAGRRGASGLDATGAAAEKPPRERREASTGKPGSSGEDGAEAGGDDQ
ncbi:MAG TPA: translocation/assembly module TamB domain-containing protein [Noviherbaspirillum sp.]|jgi:translocation and assembly module TamB|uniref:translocation/assembly module TamB domain-containing protein n=1 Tax=Noviherbaspirillum sp. TaxID=1926288 RepID=UPI002F9517ED